MSTQSAIVDRSHNNSWSTHARATVALGVPLVLTFLETHTVPRFPTAILATGLMILAFLNLFAGLILDTVVRGRREVRRLAYLGVKGPLNT